MNFGRKTMLGRYSDRTLIRMIRKAEAEERRGKMETDKQQKEEELNAKSKNEEDR